MTPRALLSRATAGLLSGFLLACTAPGDQASDAATGGTLVVVAPAEPRSLLPAIDEASQAAPILASLYERLADIGPTLETAGDAGFTPRLASSWQWATDSLSLAFTLDSTARWHDGHRVSAHDVRFTFRVYTSDSIATDQGSLVSNIDSVAVVDSSTAVFWFKRRSPQQFYDATFHMYIMPAHRLDSIPLSRLAESPLAREPIGTGRFRFARWDPQQRIEIVADTTHPKGRPFLDRVIFSIAPDFGAATIKLFAGDADLLENIKAENLAQLARTPSLRLVDNPAMQYRFLGFNLRDPSNPTQPHPIFSDVAVRRALSMAVDRERIVRNAYDSLGLVALGPAPRALIPDTTAFTGLPFDLARARTLLDSAGWVDRDNDGVRERNGVKLAFDMVAPNSSPAAQRLTVLLQAQFKAVGANATPQLLEINSLSERVDEQRFDTYTGGWLSSPGLVGMRQTWTSTGDGNAVRYQNATFDAAVDSALTTFDRAASRRHWAQAFQQILDDAPAIWLVEPRVFMAMHRRFIVPTLRPEGWYANLADWRVDPAQRIDRDRIGLAGPTR